ncbi:MAG: hypothetical protein GTO40_09420 [Deltaproteobacteria bacterium]|nr:hypothetical protein [Deltaproteobacteria bacterium]
MKQQSADRETVGSMQGAANKTGDQSQQERDLAQRRKVRRKELNRRLAQTRESGKTCQIWFFVSTPGPRNKKFRHRGRQFRTEISGWRSDTSKDSSRKDAKGAKSGVFALSLVSHVAKGELFLFVVVSVQTKNKAFFSSEPLRTLRLFGE